MMMMMMMMMQPTTLRWQMILMKMVHRKGQQGLSCVVVLLEAARIRQLKEVKY